MRADHALLKDLVLASPQRLGFAGETWAADASLGLCLRPLTAFSLSVL